MATTKTALTNNWVSVATGEMTIQRKGAGSVLLADASYAPTGDDNSFSLNDYEPRMFIAPTDGTWWAKSVGVGASVVVQE